MASPNFGDTAFEGAIQPEVPIVDPVRDNSELFRAEGLGNAAKEVGAGVSQAISFFGSALDTQKKAKTSGVLARFQEDVMLIADAVEQGLSVPAARMRIRALHGQYLADNPSLQDDLNNLHGKLVQTNGLANITTTGNEDYQRNQKLIDEAYKGGWIVPGEDPSIGTANYINAKRESEALDALKRRVEWKQQNRLEITEEDKWQASNMLRQFVLTADPWIQAQIATAKNRVDSGEDRGVVLQQLEETIGIELQKIGTLKALGAEGDMSYLLSGVQKQIDAYKKWSSGEYTTEAYNDQIKRIETHNKLVIMSDPEMGPLISASNLIGNTDPTLITRISQASMRMFGQNAQATTNPDGTLTYKKPADVIGREEEINGYLITLKSAIDNSVANPTPETVKEAGVHINNLLRGIYKHGMSSDDAREFTSVVDFFASPSVGKFSEMNGDIIPKSVRDEASRVLEDNYEKVLLPLVREKYEEAIETLNRQFPELETFSSATLGGTDSSLDENVDRSAIIEPFWNGSGVEFRVKAGTGLESNAVVVSAVNSLNNGAESIANPLNTLIRASAHMQGNTDYRRMYEENIMQRLWGAPAAGSVSNMVSNIDELAGGFATEAEASSDRDAYFAAIRKQESGGDDNAKNPTSSATGRYQFITSTWNRIADSPEGKAAGVKRGGRLDPEQQEKAIRIFTEWNSQTLKRNGLPDNNGNLYAMHFLGDATPVLTAADNVQLSDILSPRVMNANKFLKGKTVSWFKKWVNKVGN